MMNWIDDPSSFVVGLSIGVTGGLCVRFVQAKIDETRKRYRRWKELRDATRGVNGQAGA